MEVQKQASWAYCVSHTYSIIGGAAIFVNVKLFMQTYEKKETTRIVESSWQLGKTQMQLRALSIKWQNTIQQTCY